MVSMSIAMTEDGVIGSLNQLPWKDTHTEELKWFRKNTINKTVMMGRNTYQSIGKPLDKRKNIVLSSRLEDDAVIVARSIEHGMALADSEELVVIGGAEVYWQTLSYVTRIYLTIIKGSFSGDTYAPIAFIERALSNWIEQVQYEDEKMKVSILSSTLPSTGFDLDSAFNDFGGGYGYGMGEK